MEFLDIKFNKDSSHLLHAIHSSFYWRIWKKTILFSGFKNPYKKIFKTLRILNLLIAFCRTEKWG